MPRSLVALPGDANDPNRKWTDPADLGRLVGSLHYLLTDPLEWDILLCTAPAGGF